MTRSQDMVWSITHIGKHIDLLTPKIILHKSQNYQLFINQSKSFKNGTKSGQNLAFSPLKF